MLTKEQIERVNAALDWFNTCMEQVNARDPWQEQGETGPTLVTIQNRRELLNILDVRLSEVHSVEPRCNCGRCGR